MLKVERSLVSSRSTSSSCLEVISTSLAVRLSAHRTANCAKSLAAPPPRSFVSRGCSLIGQLPSHDKTSLAGRRRRKLRQLCKREFHFWRNKIFPGTSFLFCCLVQWLCDVSDSSHQSSALVRHGTFVHICFSPLKQTVCRGLQQSSVIT